MKFKALALLLLFVFASSFNIAMASGAAGAKAWIGCKMITISGDTLYAEVKNKKDYTAEGSLIPANELPLKQAGGKVVKWNIKDLKEIIIMGKPDGYNHYLSLNNNSTCPGQYNLYRVVTDGACKFLCREVPATSGKMVQTTVGPNDFSIPLKLAHDEYSIYYDGKLTVVMADDDLNLNPI